MELVEDDEIWVKMTGQKMIVWCVQRANKSHTKYISTLCIHNVVIIYVYVYVCIMYF